ncbi:TetR/AcrR family transcriptional regulator [Paenibacillus sp. YPG26]|uniref:TetR/AcrR family transcriptional regulator n=1 Tax=Paenibacillus sp. YPG26 TaxID=2878915 RepID=UPI00203B0681|nr:TetR/AcrR family transcriptional regulator [Paenibacillus sp. YPG26]USB33662.1 TetR/AcrR family transcriptional regulator [Paenibacillus sp. YPG26]
MKQRIIDATISLIQRKGFNFTISDLARQLSISKRTIYDNFSSKDDIIEEVITQLIGKIRTRERQIAEDNQLNEFQKIKHILICVPEEFAIMDSNMLVELKQYHFNQWRTLDTFLKDEWSVVRDLLNKGIEKGIIKNIHPLLFTELYLGAINQIYDVSSPLRNLLTMGEILNSVVDVLLEGIVVPNMDGA